MLNLTQDELDQLQWMTEHFLRIRQGSPEEQTLRSLAAKLQECEPPGTSRKATAPLAPHIEDRGAGQSRRETTMTRVITPTTKRRTAPQPPKPFDSDQEPDVTEENEEDEEELVTQATPRRTAAAAKAKAEVKPAAKATTKKAAAPKDDAPAVKPVKRAPKPTEEPLSHDELIERKRLAGAGRSQTPGTTFGSRWTDDEREELKDLCESLSGAEAAAAFVKKNPHRTVQGALYQISRNGY